ncbi:MAG: hypothetical protein ACNA7O_12705 [Rhodobacterales bacterium]
MNNMLCGDAQIFAALDARDFLKSHGSSLSEVLHVIAGDRGIDLFCEADCSLDSLSPDPARVGKALRDIHDLLAEAKTPSDRYADSFRWHGARVADIAARLSR